MILLNIILVYVGLMFIILIFWYLNKKSIEAENDYFHPFVGLDYTDAVKQYMKKHKNGRH